MFATLVGTDTGDTRHKAVFDQLYQIASERGFLPPHNPVRIRPDGRLDGWSLEQKGPYGDSADFLLAVTAPRIPGMSPIFPVFKTIDGPLFAVVVLESAFVVSRADRRDVSELKDSASVARSFGEFLDKLPKQQ